MGARPFAKERIPPYRYESRARVKPSHFTYLSVYVQLDISPRVFFCAFRAYVRVRLSALLGVQGPEPWVVFFGPATFVFARDLKLACVCVVAPASSACIRAGSLCLMGTDLVCTRHTQAVQQQQSSLHAAPDSILLRCDMFSMAVRSDGRMKSKADSTTPPISLGMCYVKVRHRYSQRTLPSDWLS